jgi:hypothetical protein
MGLVVCRKGNQSAEEKETIKKKAASPLKQLFNSLQNYS